MFTFGTWTCDLDAHPVLVEVYGIASSSTAIGNFLSSLKGTITGASTLLGTTRIPLPLQGPCSFRVPFERGVLTGEVVSVLPEKPPPPQEGE